MVAANESLFLLISSAPSTNWLRSIYSPVKIDDHQLKLIDLYGRLATLLLTRSEADDLAVTRRIGFEKVLGLIQFDDRKEDIKFAFQNDFHSWPKDTEDLGMVYSTAHFRENRDEDIVQFSYAIPLSDIFD